MTKTNKVGRKSLFFTVPSIRGEIVNNLKAGASMKDSAALAGVGEATFHEWVQIGEAHIDGVDHRRMPQSIADREEFAEFARQIKNGVAHARRIQIENVRRSGLNYWRHRLTGIVIYTAPKPITYVNIATGEISYQAPEGFDPNAPAKDAQFLKQWSGEAWEEVSGTWQASAWFLERSDPESWGRIHNTHMVEHKGKIEVEGSLNADSLAQLYKARNSAG